MNFALKSSKQKKNSLSEAFFSEQNIDYIQKRIILETKRITGYKIGTQNKDSLLIIMHNIYSYATSSILGTDLLDIISRLNQAVLQKCVRQCVSGIDMYIQYTKDASMLPIPLDHPIKPTIEKVIIS
jgi:hypothetical protein